MGLIFEGLIVDKGNIMGNTMCENNPKSKEPY